jgi:hypothetical protein
MFESGQLLSITGGRFGPLIRRMNKRQFVEIIVK